MIVRFTTPSRVLGAWRADKLVAEGEHGSFCLKPRHIDWVGILGVGISEIELTPDDNDDSPREIFVAHDSGVLVKRADEVLVSVRRGIVSADLDELHETVEKVFRHVDSQEQRARAAAGKLEVGFVRRFLELEESTGG
jgi:F-type H+-transporting ATPase subunit epsilon